MKKLIPILITLLFLSTQLFSNGVAVVDVSNATYFKLIDSQVDISVENQVAIVNTIQVFKNVYSSAKSIKYAFPMPEDGSATRLLFKVNDSWYEAEFAPTPQDTTLPGSGDEIDENLKTYLGETPLYYNLEHIIQPDSFITIQLTYVQLLSYEFGKVDLYYQSDYRYIQTAPLDQQKIAFHLTSERTINYVDLVGETPSILTNDGHDAYLEFTRYDKVPEYNYHVEYELSLDELGLFSMSTSIPDTLVPDQHGPGYFTFIVEPDPSENTDIINKVFTLIVDRSGSMYGDKIVQARNAAKFIVENLNEGDYFNIVDFSGGISNFRNEHVEFNASNESAALSYINSISANGSTNISGAFDRAVPQFSSTDETTANIIIFFTDGQATSGVTETGALLQHIQNLINQYELELALFTFGIGHDVNKQLLTVMASQNNGISEFLESNELEEVITRFYLTIRNPVLLNTQMSFLPSGSIMETYPRDLSNLYKGQQMYVSGRYVESVPVTIQLNGTAFGKQVSYEYQLQPADSTVEKYQFLTKIWAKQKIEYLLVEYFSEDDQSVRADSLKSAIIDISLDYGVLSPFTSFSGDKDTTPIEEEIGKPDIAHSPVQYELLGNYPNPFNPSTTIRFRVNTPMSDVIIIKIYNSIGQLVRELSLHISGPGNYQILWDGLFNNGITAPTGTYFYTVDFGEDILYGKMQLVK